MLLMLGTVSGEVETFTSSPEDCDPAEILGIIDRALDTALNRSSEGLNATEASLVPEQALNQKNTTGDFFNLFSSNHTLSVLYDILRQDLASANLTNESANVQSDEQSASSIRPALLVDSDEIVTFPPNNEDEVDSGESKCKFLYIISLIKYYF